MNLQEWLDWQQGLHPQKIDLGLDRVVKVAQTMGLSKPNCPVITVAGTNGKGSSIAFLEGILTSAGYRVGAYTSPHLQCYNERIRISMRAVEDAFLCQVFAQINVARASISLSYFEFGTLAALALFEAAKLDVILLEVGLGGRLDAVNIVDPDVALITTIDLDHQQWLGQDREAIGREKAGILRPSRPWVYADSDPPQSVIETAQRIGAPCYCVGQAYWISVQKQGWNWDSPTRSLHHLPWPTMLGEHQLANAAASIMVLELVVDRLPVAESSLRDAISKVMLPGRFQRLATGPEIILDCAHNPQAAKTVAKLLEEFQGSGRTYVVLGMMVDKDIQGVLLALEGHVDMWYMSSFNEDRAAAAEHLASLTSGPSRCFASVPAGLAAARAQAVAKDRILVMGSFYVLDAALTAMKNDLNQPS